MGNAPNVVAAAGVPSDSAIATRVLEAFRAQIGADRFAVWFGDAARVKVVANPATDGASSASCVVLTIASGFTHEWLRRTFRVEFEAAARDICGGFVEVAWEPQPEGARPLESLPTPAEPPRQLCVVARPPQSPAAPVAPVRRQPPRLAEFVVGPSNRMAYAAVEMAVGRPGEVSPLVIHGPSGVGKTHLLEAACERARELHPGSNAVCLSAEQFTTAFLQALHGGGLPGFRRTCRTADVLVIDELQFFVGKKATLLEVQQTLDALQRHGKQLILGCDRELDALPDLGGDFLTRLRGGMVARILAPDYDVRRGIVASVCGKRGLTVPDDVLHYIATSMTRHARELLGAVNRLEATALMLGVPISLGMAEESLADLVRSSARSVRLADIERAVCKAFGIETGSLQSSRRARTASHPRMLAMFLARKHTQAALSEIGTYFGRRSHSTVIAAQKAVGDWVAKGAPIRLADASWDVEEAIRRVEDMLRAG